MKDAEHPRNPSSQPLPRVAERSTSSSPSVESIPILSPLTPRDYSQPFVLLKFNLVVTDCYVLSGKVTGKQDGKHPQVMLRLTRDRWQTFEDLPATVNPIQETKEAGFALTIQAKAEQHLEFAIRMYVDSEECWDSDHGKNFAVVLPALEAQMRSSPPTTHQRRASNHRPQASEGSESFVSASEGENEEERPSRAWIDSLPTRRFNESLERPVSTSASSTSSWDRNTAITSPTVSDSALASHQNSYGQKPNALPPRIFLTRTESDRLNISRNASVGEELTATTPPPQVAAPSYAINQQATLTRSLANTSEHASTMVVPTAPARVSASEIRYGLVKERFEHELDSALPPAIAMPTLYSQGPPPPLVPVSPNQSRPSSIKGTSPSRSRPSSIKSSSEEQAPAVMRREEASPSQANTAFFPASPPDSNAVSSNRLGSHFDPFAPRRRTSFDSHSIRSEAMPPSRRYSSLHERDASVSSLPKGRAASLMNAPAGGSINRNPIKSTWTAANLSNTLQTMCAIAIAAGAAEAMARKTQKKTRFFGGKRKPAPVLAGDWTDVRFTEIAEIPGKIKAGEVLVQVWATALDFWDKARIETLVKRGDGFGFVPGRSFCGRVVDVGVDVKLKKGEVVYGMTDIKKVCFSPQIIRDFTYSILCAVWCSGGTHSSG